MIARFTVAGAVWTLALVSTASATTPIASEVVVVKHAHVPLYQEAQDEFTERCRLPTRLVSIDDNHVLSNDALGHNTRVVVAIGQDALDSIATYAGARIAIFANYPLDGVATAPVGGTAEQIFRVIRLAVPKARRVAVLFGPRSTPSHALAAAAKLGLDVIPLKATDGPSALRLLQALPPTADILWLPADPDVVSVQVFRFALRLQLERRLPIIAATRQQVHSGALFAIDFSPRALGRAVADAVNNLARSQTSIAPQLATVPTLLTINRLTASRLGVDVTPLQSLGARFE